jgi:hypothetical protein
MTGKVTNRRTTFEGDTLEEALEQLKDALVRRSDPMELTWEVISIEDDTGKVFTSEEIPDEDIASALRKAKGA